jgi:hypothetical protein
MTEPKTRRRAVRKKPFEKAVEAMCALGVRDFLEFDKVLKNYKKHMLKQLTEGTSEEFVQ